MNEQQVIAKIRCLCRQIELLEAQIVTLTKDIQYQKTAQKDYQQAYDAAITELLLLIVRNRDKLF